MSIAQHISAGTFYSTSTAVRFNTAWRHPCTSLKHIPALDSPCSPSCAHGFGSPTEKTHELPQRGISYFGITRIVLAHLAAERHPDCPFRTL